MSIAIPITLTYAGLLGLVFTVLSLGVALYRRGHKISSGDGGDKKLFRRIRGHGNFTEYVPMALVLIAGVEILHYPAWLVHLLGGGLLLARIAHGYAFWDTVLRFKSRVGGATATIIIIMVASILITLSMVMGDWQVAYQ